MQSATLKLKHPVTIDGVTTSTLTFRRPKAKDLMMIEKAAANGYAAAQIATIAALSDVAVGVIEELDVEDYLPAEEKAAGFFPQENSKPSPKTAGAAKSRR